ncbi:hypothetical protein DL98DRAFT_659183 [Cadophora sp. DSE1049]|nr:hypothetical protein DL98DRAFT_659183 [Cadophora sp. DSE1049]
MGPRSQPGRAVKRKLAVQSTSTSSRETQSSASAAALHVLPNPDNPTSISFPFNGFRILISLPDVANATAEEVQQFKQLIPQLERSFKRAARYPARPLESAPTRTDILPFTFDCVPLSLSLPDFQNASSQGIKKFSQVVAHTMSFFQQEAAKPQKRGRGRPRASSVVARPRAASVDSVASDQSTESQARAAIRGTTTRVTYKEKEAIKQIAPHLVGDLDEYPSYLLENVTVEVPSGLSPADADYARNILHQLQGNRASGLKVTGLLSVEEAQKARLIKYVDGEHANLNKQYITLDNVLAFSIGLAEVTLAPALWVLSETGWFEIRPHSEYRFVYSNMCKAIGLKFFIEEWYKDPKSAQTWNSNDDEILEILREFTAFVIGATDTQDQWVLRCREYKQFFLTQLDQATNAAVLQKSSIYQWLDQGCPDLQPSIAVQPYGPEADAPHFYPVADNSDDESDYEEDGFEFDEDVDDPHDQVTVAQVGMILSMTKPWKGPYISSQYPQGTPFGVSIPVHLATFICHMGESGRCKDLNTLSVDSIAAAICRDFSIHEYVACQKLLRYLGQEVAAELPDEYCGYNFYKALATSPKELTVHDEELKKLTDFENGINTFTKIIEGRKVFIRRSTSSMVFSNAKNHAIKNNQPIPPRPKRNSRRKAPAGLGPSSFSQQQAPGSFNPDVEMKNGQSSSLAPLKPYHERYSAPKWTPELEHCVSPSMRSRWLASLTAEQRSLYYQETINTLYEKQMARDALKTPEQLAQEERTRRIKKKRLSYRKYGGDCY